MGQIEKNIIKNEMFRKKWNSKHSYFNTVWRETIAILCHIKINSTWRPEELL
jgi:hypothetical protein